MALIEGGNAEGEGVCGGVCESGFGHEVEEGVAAGEGFNGRVKIAIGGGVSGDEAADPGQNMPEIEEVKGAEKRVLREGEFEDEGASAGS